MSPWPAPRAVRSRRSTPASPPAIEENSYAAIKGDKSVSQALKDMQAAITAATSGN